MLFASTTYFDVNIPRVAGSYPYLGVFGVVRVPPSTAQRLDIWTFRILSTFCGVFVRAGDSSLREIPRF